MMRYFAPNVFGSALFGPTFGHSPTPAPTPAPGISRPDFSSAGVAPVFFFHPHTEVPTLAGETIVAVDGRDGLPGLASPAGPSQIVDPLGRTAWRFADGQYLDLPDSFATPSTQQFTIFMSGRLHRPLGAQYLFSPKYLSDGTTLANTISAFFGVYSSNGLAPWLRCTNVLAHSAAANAEHFAVGSQLSVYGVASRPAANGGCRFFMNGVSGGSAQAYGVANLRGGRIGGYPYAGPNVSGFDLYAMVGFAGILTDAQAAAVSSVLTQAYGVAPLTRQLIIEGDSIFQGVGSVSVSNNIAMALTQPQPALLPPDIRVINMAVSGARIANLVTRRDTNHGWPSTLLSGEGAVNLLLVQIGRNDVISRLATDIYADIVDYCSRPDVGVLSRGFDICWGTNIATAPSLQGEIDGLRTLLRHPDFKALAPGRIKIADLAMIEEPIGETIFDSSTDAVDQAYYQNDSTHPNSAGTIFMASGGATPEYGLAAIL